MILGVDLDGTFAADVATFKAVVELFHAAGHKCVLITNRGPEDRAVVERIVAGCMPCLFSNGRPKREIAREAGYEVNVWIDDNPCLVDFGSAGLALCGEQH
jgi:ribonucleotide monophosphatase NagD (HAD superfamily)